MALSKQIDEFSLTLGLIRYTFKLQNQTIDFVEEYFNGETSKLALSGKKITRFAGYRMRASIDFSASLEPSNFRDFFNAMYTHFITDDNNSMIFLPDAFTDIDVVLTSASYRMVYNNQVGRFIPSLEIESENRLTSIPSGFQAP